MADDGNTVGQGQQVCHRQTHPAHTSFSNQSINRLVKNQAFSLKVVFSFNKNMFKYED